MAKLSKDVKVALEGVMANAEAGNVTIKTYAATAVITEAMASAGVDTRPMATAIMKLAAHEQKALEDKSMTPDELRVPRPAGYDDERAANLAASFASSIRSDRQARWMRVIAGLAIVATIVAAVL